jgi:hypothetical protein
MKTHILCFIAFPENCTVYEIMSKNCVETGGGHMTSQYGSYPLRAGLARLYARMQVHTSTRPGTHMHARTSKHAHTDQYVILTAFPQQQWFPERASVLRYTCFACLVVVKATHLSLRHMSQCHLYFRQQVFRLRLPDIDSACITKKWRKIFVYLKLANRIRDSAVGIATRYGLMCPGFELWWEQTVFFSPYRSDRP